MSEQWFLDLDGIRSGPYHTTEVLSLIGEGEILPHHQIAQELKSQKWVSVLEWRLTQKKTEIDKSPIPQSSLSPALEAKNEVPMTAAQEPKKISKPTTAPPISFPQEPNTNGKKADPMMAMFDIIQDTKSKREARSQQSHHQASSHATPTTHVQTPILNAHKPQSSQKTGAMNAWSKTIIAAVIISIVGFFLGQYFQKQKNETDTATAPIAAPSGNTQNGATENQNAVNESATSVNTDAAPTEIVDRSNDKITIRAKVAPNHDNPAAHQTGTPAAKDMEEIRDLKKELMELKAMKDEMRNNPHYRPYGNQPNGRLNDPYSADPQQQLPNEDPSISPEAGDAEDVQY